MIPSSEEDANPPAFPRQLAVAGVATGMAIIGTALVTMRLMASSGSTLAWLMVNRRLIPIVIFLSNFIWLPVGVAFARNPPSLWTALLIGAASPLVGCLLIASTYGLAI